jgi:hypothetical protein
MVVLRIFYEELEQFVIFCYEISRRKNKEKRYLKLTLMNKSLPETSNYNGVE